MVRVRYDRGLNCVFSHNVEKIRVARIESDGIFTVFFGCLLLDHYLSLYSSELGIVVLLQFD